MNNWSADNRQPYKSCYMEYNLHLKGKKWEKKLSLVKILGGREVRDCITERGNWE